MRDTYSSFNPEAQAFTHSFAFVVYASGDGSNQLTGNGRLNLRFTVELSRRDARRQQEVFLATLF